MASSGKASLSSPLAASFPPGRARSGQADDAVDGVQPGLVVTARDDTDVQTVIREARKEHVAVIPTGGGTGIEVGNLPRAFDLRLNLTGMTAVLDRYPEDLCVTVQAGVTLARLQKLLAADRQRVGIDPPLPARATLGGIVAGNASGMTATRFGLPRDQVLGLTAVDGNARILRVGGSVVKNVAGYDLARLFAGSRGSLAVITELTLRTHPIAPRSEKLRFDFAAATDLAAAVRAVSASELPLAGWEFSIEGQGENRECSMIVALEGTEPGVEYQRNRLAELCCKGAAAKLEADESAALHPRPGDCVVLSATMPPAEAVAVAEEPLRVFRRYDASVRVAGRPADGFVRFASARLEEARIPELLRELSVAAGTRLVCERLPAAVKRDVDVWGPVPTTQPIMRALKERFDPRGILAPGRLAGRL